MSQRKTPPFRADHVGSLLRPAALKDARTKFAKGEIDAAALKAVEDREIERAIKKQEEIGLKLATDGEFRRSWWHFDFFKGLKGVESFTTSTGIQFKGVETKHEGIKITSKVDFALGEFGARLFQRRRAQQTADHVGAKRRRGALGHL